MRPTTSASGTRRGLRPLALAFAVLTMWAHLASLAHMALVRHVACAEHGELVHPGAASDARSVATHPSTESVQDGAARVDQEHHEHCGIAAHRRDQVTHAAGAETVVDIARPAGAVVTILAPESALLAGRALYRIAPKTSPPV